MYGIGLVVSVAVNLCTSCTFIGLQRATKTCENWSKQSLPSLESWKWIAPPNYLVFGTRSSIQFGGLSTCTIHLHHDSTVFGFSRFFARRRMRAGPRLRARRAILALTGWRTGGTVLRLFFGLTGEWRISKRSRTSRFSLRDTPGSTLLHILSRRGE